jgi:hypothetical protein
MRLLCATTAHNIYEIMLHLNLSAFTSTSFNTFLESNQTSHSSPPPSQVFSDAAALLHHRHPAAAVGGGPVPG